MTMKFETVIEDIPLEKGEAVVEEGMERTGRDCGSCSMCCHTLSIETPELSKPSNVWCKHCRPGHGGCSIYDSRPMICRAFGCLWLINDAVRDYWFPQKAKIVVHLDRNNKQTLPVLSFNVDKRFPNRWREEPYFTDIKEFAVSGLEGSGLMGAPGFRFQTYVNVGEKKYLILPHREVDTSGKPGMIMQTGRHSFEWFEAKSHEAAVEAIRFMDGMDR